MIKADEGSNFLTRQANLMSVIYLKSFLWSLFWYAESLHFAVDEFVLIRSQRENKVW